MYYPNNMATFPHLLLILLVTILFLFYFLTRPGKRPSPPTNWLVIGMLPAVIMHINHAHDYITTVLAQTGGSFQFKGPWFCNLDMLVTCDPSIINHVFTKNFPNYPKGPEFRKIFEILGDGVVNTDHELWELHRKTTLHLLTRAEFYPSLHKIIWDKVETGLLPVLDSFSAQNADFDAQEIFQRFAFDNICKIVFGDDPQSLILGLPHVPCEKAFTLMADPLMHMHVIPETIWRLQKQLGVGKEKVLNKANQAFDEFIYPRVTSFLINEGGDGDECKVLKAFFDAYGDKKSMRSFLRDTALNLMLAGRDTTSTCFTWLFWLLAGNPSKEAKILEEIEKELDMKEKWRFFSIEESRKLTYLHGALCESLRLFPPVALEHKSPVQTDYLPSGALIPL